MRSKRSEQANTSKLKSEQATHCSPSPDINHQILSQLIQSVLQTSQRCKVGSLDRPKAGVNSVSVSVGRRGDLFAFGYLP